jgi:multisubunit Na+/H+ antiporter MnhB subunit
VPLAGLSTGHMVGLAVVAAVFISFALASSFLAPRRWPDFPGRQGLSVFVIACFVLFAAMLTAVEVFGVEKSESKSEKAKSAPALHVQAARPIASRH